MNVLNGMYAKFFVLAVKYPWVGTLLLGVGEQSINWASTIVNGVINAVAVIGGLVLIGFGIKGVIKGWIPDNKDVKGIIIGIMTVIVGAVLTVAGGAGCVSLAKRLGSDWNMVH